MTQLTFWGKEIHLKNIVPSERKYRYYKISLSHSGTESVLTTSWGAFKKNTKGKPTKYAIRQSKAVSFDNTDSANLASGLLYSALSEGGSWSFENKEVEKEKKKEENRQKEDLFTREFEKKLEEEQEASRRQQEKDDQDHEEATKNTELVTKAKNQIMAELPKIELDHPMFRAKLKYRILEKYRMERAFVKEGAQ